MPDAYDRITLLCRLKTAQTRNKEQESGERYVRLKELHQKECREYGSRILELQKEAADAHKETIRVRNYWFQVLEDMLAHVLRYLKGSMDNEPDRTWNKDMRSLVQEMIHFRNGLQPSEEADPCKVSEFEERYRKILETARKEYENVPANDYYRDGYNLFLRIEKYMQNHLLFLHDLRVPATNNEAERLLRNYKRKQAQAVTFRSFESIDYLCQCMSMLVLMRLEEPENIFDRVSRIFG